MTKSKIKLDPKWLMVFVPDARFNEPNEIEGDSQAQLDTVANDFANTYQFKHRFRQDKEGYVSGMLLAEPIGDNASELMQHLDHFDLEEIVFSERFGIPLKGIQGSGYKAYVSLDYNRLLADTRRKRFKHSVMVIQNDDGYYLSNQ